MKTVGFALVAALSFTAPAFADTGNWTIAREVSVSYADLNLDSEAGRQTLKTRVENAVRTACGPRAGRPYAEVQACRADARENVIAQSTGVVRQALQDMEGFDQHASN